ncbi:hypothetical protein VTN96DRAFT_9053 [Rasamsonia emersonii]
MVDSLRQPCQDAYMAGEFCSLRRWRFVSVPLARPCDICLVEGEEYGEEGVSRGLLRSSRDNKYSWLMFFGGIVLAVLAVVWLLWVPTIEMNEYAIWNGSHLARTK